MEETIADDGVLDVQGNQRDGKRIMTQGGIMQEQDGYEVEIEES